MRISESFQEPYLKGQVGTVYPLIPVYVPFCSNKQTRSLDRKALAICGMTWEEVMLTWVTLNTRTLFITTRNTVLACFWYTTSVEPMYSNTWQISDSTKWILTKEEENYSDLRIQIPRTSWTKWAVLRGAPGKLGLRSSGMALPTETLLRKSVILHFLTAVCGLLRMSALW